MEREAQSSSLNRPRVEALDALLGKPWRVLDDGFVRIIDYMGSDDSIVQAARVSYGLGTKQVHEDRGLIRYLMRHGHTTPFEMCEIKFHLRLPMDCWRQWIRHRTANVNEYSTRYSVAIDAAQRTEADDWRLQAHGNRQGSAGSLDRTSGERLCLREEQLHDLAREVYRERLELGIAREQARKDLPLSTYTEAYWKIDLHNLLHFLALRMDPHAQQEIRSYACLIGEEIIAAWCPLTWEAFVDYRQKAITLTRIDQLVINALCTSGSDAAHAMAQELGWLTPGPRGLKKHRERLELESKLERLGLEIPW